MNQHFPYYNGISNLPNICQGAVYVLREGSSFVEYIRDSDLISVSEKIFNIKLGDNTCAWILKCDWDMVTYEVNYCNEVPDSVQSIVNQVCKNAPESSDCFEFLTKIR